MSWGCPFWGCMDYTEQDLHKIYINYLLMKVEDRDWHAVSDAANDLRELEIKFGKQDQPKVLDRINEIDNAIQFFSNTHSKELSAIRKYIGELKNDKIRTNKRPSRSTK
jgi:hypothetical protein